MCNEQSRIKTIYILKAHFKNNEKEEKSQSNRTLNLNKRRMRQNVIE